MKPFLLLAVRADDAAADNEYESFLACTGLHERDLRRYRLEQRPLGNVELQDWSGILLGGGPFTASDPEESKSPVQRRVEADLRGVLEKVISADFPFLGAGYGIGTLGHHQGAVVDRRYAEPIGAVPVTLTREGRHDPLLRGLPATFDAFVGHKEAGGRGVKAESRKEPLTHRVLCSGVKTKVACPLTGTGLIKQAVVVGRPWRSPEIRRPPASGSLQAANLSSFLSALFETTSNK